jgi:DMSO/TMAO reductase YedYZ molybdopterin-dependent catalytic subunit
MPHVTQQTTPTPAPSGPGPTDRLARRARFGRLAVVARGALAGLLAGGVALGGAELAAAAVRPEAAPVVAVGGAAIDRTPTQLKEFAVRHFGTDDKLVLELGILVVLAFGALLLGAVAAGGGASRPRRAICAVAALGLGAVGAVAAANRPDARALDPLPSALAALAAAGTLYVLTGLAARPTAPGTDTTTAVPVNGRSRRRFLRAAGGAALASAGAGAAGHALLGRAGAGAAASRRDVVLPAPASPARPIPRGADLRVPGAQPFLTPNAAFYRVDTALVVPRVDATRWRLVIDGEGVTRPLSLGYRELLARPLVERTITLTCVSNQVGGPYTGTARWIGVRLADLLTEAGVRRPSRGGRADQLVAHSVDGMTLGSPVETVLDGRDAMIALGMSGEPLPFAHGFPARMIVPGLYGYVSACKWLSRLELTTFDAYDPYWVRRGWSREAPIKTESRIDTPRPFARPSAGTVPVAGVAWAQHRGIDRVQVRVDGGPWHDARLAAEDTTDTWRQWCWEWPATRGTHRLKVRATDRTGTVQTARRTGTLPNGATGRHSVVVTVT